MLFDTHAHYDDERFDEDRDALLASMPENNVGLILNPGCDAETSRKAVGYANRYPFVYAAVGLHPENIEDGWTQTLDEIRTLAQSEPRVRAIGEIGLDYYWDNEPHEVQQKWFIRQLELAGEVKKPVIIHSREAAADTMYIMKNYAVHCILVVICIFITVLASVQGTWFMQTLIDGYILPLIGQADPDFSGLLHAIMRVAIFYLIGALASYIYTRIMVNVSQGTLKNLRDDMFR